jgi:hypothetical protein
MILLSSIVGFDLQGHGSLTSVTHSAQAESSLQRRCWLMKLT